jgi:hypothetical protein
MCILIFKVENSHRSLDGKMRDLCDGSEYSVGNHPLFSVNLKAIQLILYYDDFEVANPLGAKAVIHKIGKYFNPLSTIALP